MKNTNTLNLDIFKGITAFAVLDNDKKVELECSGSTDYKLSFSCEKYGISLDVVLKDYANGKVLSYVAKYNPQNLDFFGGNHFGVEQAIGLNIQSIDLLEKYVATYRSCPYWVSPSFGSDISKLPNNTQAILGQVREDNYFFATALCDDIFKSTIRGNENGGMDIFVWSNDLRNKVSTSALYYGFGTQPFELAETVMKNAMSLLGRPVKMRDDRTYPEVLEYLGWCSWDAFQMFVTHEDLVNKAEEFKEKEIPVKWMLLDDMWGDVDNNNTQNFHSRELNSFEAAPSRFPNGLKGIVNELQEHYDMKVGLWHPTTGYWHGINPASQLAEEYREWLFYSYKKGELVHSFEKEKVAKYYDLQHKFYKDCGVDFIKVDNQSFVKDYSQLTMPIGTVAENLHLAIEGVADKYYDGALINCMGMALENFWHRRDSAVTRFSGDFHPEDHEWFIKHLLQCSYNSIVQGTVYVGDWDMWWSDDGQAKPNALIHAMSGGPIYLSDKMDRSIKDTIMPTVYSDGRIIRLMTPAKPTVDCLFTNPVDENVAFKLFNTHNDCGVLAVFNISKDESEVKTTISASDMLLRTDKKYCVYNWYGETVKEVAGDEEIKVSLKDFEDYRLYLFVPILEDIAVVGLKDKYMSVATYSFEKGNLKVFDNGEVMIYSRHQLVIDGNSIEAYKDNLYKVNVEKNKEYILQTKN